MNHFLEVVARLVAIAVAVIGVAAIGMSVWSMFERLASCH